MLKYRDVLRQSQNVWKQFGESRWIPNATFNARLERRDTEELRNCGVGKALVSVAMGASLETKVDAIKRYRSKVDVVCCDKAFQPLVDRGITPDFVLMADANIETKWLKDWDKTKNVKLLATPYANPEWTKRWQGPKYFYVNLDAIDSQHRFLEIMGSSMRTIPASSNVSNAQVVFMTGADNDRRADFAAYSRIYLVGYDYSWKVGGNYYAWEDPKPKRYYMAHRTLMDMNRDYVRTSENLLFSARWLFSYIAAHQLPVVNCSGTGILDIASRSDLEKELKSLKTSPEKADAARKALDELKAAHKRYAKTKSDFVKAVEV